MKIMLTGGTGRLGTELQKLRQFDYVPVHRAGEYDITDLDNLMAYVLDKRIDLIVHCAAFTAVELAERNRELCYKTNTMGTCNISSLLIPVLAISTEYAANPTNYYAKTKEAGEKYADKVLRLSFKPRPFPYPRAFTDQWTTGDYIDVIATEVNLAIDLYDYLPRGITNIGTERKTIFDLAKQTRDVKPMSRLEIKTAILPEDTSLNTTEWERIKREHSSSQTNR